MNYEWEASIFTRKPDLSSGSNDLYFQGDEVFKVLKPTAALYQFCADCSPSDVLAFLEQVRQRMVEAFEDILVPTRYTLEAGKIVTTQPKVAGQTLKELGLSPDNHLPNWETMNQGINRLRDNWKEDLELLGYIVDEIMDPNNIMFDGEKFILIDWL